MRLSDRMSGVRRSYIREILKVTADPQIISFAGGLPSPEHFPVADISRAAQAVLAEAGPAALQYSTTEGDPELRRWIAARYKAKAGLDVDPERILITTGSQQGLDLVGKTLVNRDDPVVVERPGYLGAIQCLSVYGARFLSVRLTAQGPDLDELAKVLEEEQPGLFYVVPNFQNPSGVSWSLATRKRVAELARKHDTVIVEDNPYGELRFLGEDLPPVRAFAGDGAVLLGSFSKVVAPGLRLGWMVAPPELFDALVRAKQAADLHSSTLTQRILARYLAENDLDAHLARIKDAYGSRREAMVRAIREHFPPEVTFTEPEGGMFLWVTLPERVKASALFQRAIAEKVAFVPGTPFYTDGSGENTLRLNFSNADPTRIVEGISRLGKAISDFLAKR